MCLPPGILLLPLLLFLTCLLLLALLVRQRSKKKIIKELKRVRAKNEKIKDDILKGLSYEIDFENLDAI
jgi:hypothetical protein